MKKILVIDDDQHILELIKYCFHKEYNVYTADTGEKGLKKIENSDFDLIILDLTLPDLSGWDVLRIIRSDKKKPYIPVLLITGTYKSETDEIHALRDFAADEYVRKPFDIDLLKARAMSLLRLKEFATKPDKSDGKIDTFVSGDLKLVVSEHLVIYKKNRIELTKMEFKLLTCFMRNKNRLLTHDEIIKLVWDDFYTHSDTHTLTRHVKTLREKLNSAGKRIVTIHGVGYKFLEK